jgi:hypothetical protein
VPRTKKGEPTLAVMSALDEVASGFKRRTKVSTPPPAKARKVGVRRAVKPAASHRDDSAPEAELMQAMQDYKKSSGRMFPTWSEVLEVLQGLGYRKLG